MDIPNADVAQNLAGQMTHWAKLIIFPSAGIMVFPALLSRDFKHVGSVAVIALVTAAFIFDGHGIQTFSTGLAHDVFSS